MKKYLWALMPLIMLVVACAPELQERQEITWPTPNWGEEITDVAVPAKISIGSSMNVGDAAKNDIPYDRNFPLTVKVPIYNGGDEWAIVETGFAPVYNASNGYITPKNLSDYVTIRDDGDFVLAIPPKHQRYLHVDILASTENKRPPDHWIFKITTKETTQSGLISIGESVTFLIDMK